MSPVNLNGSVQASNHQIVTWDLDTTGRRLIDEICHISGFYKIDSEENSFSQYVMPHKNPNPGARRSFGIKVTSMGRYRMLKDVETGRVLKTKSEISALQDFIEFLKSAHKKSQKKVILVSHEPARKVLIPLFLEAIRRYDLFDELSKVVVAFANSVKIVEKFAETGKVTSYSLRSLCKTLLNNTNPATTSACDRAKILVDILEKVANKENTLDDAKILSVSTSLSVEQAEVQNLKNVLGTQGTLRPIFEGQLKQKRAVREHAIYLRKLVAEAGLKYQDLAEIYQNQNESREKLKDSIEEASDKDIDDLVVLLDKHFIKTSSDKSTNGQEPKENSVDA